MVAILTRRSFLEIVYEILQLEGRKKTHIMYGTGLTYPQTVRYLDMLKERRLIATQLDGDGKEVYTVTDEGKDVLEHLSAVMGHLGR